MTHLPQIDDKVWDGSERPQPNGYIIEIQKEEDETIDIHPADETVIIIVEFYDSYHRRAYQLCELDPYYDASKQLYRLNEADWTEGWTKDYTWKNPNGVRSPEDDLT